jgi:arsenate reductase
VAERPFNVLFLCTGNSARSIMAESILNQLGGGRFVAYSAGSFPTGGVNPFALAILEENGMPTADLRSKPWDEFARPGAPQLDFIFTVCDRAAGETCPIWPGQPMTAHWGIADPAAVQGSDAEKRRAFANAFRELSQRIRVLTSLPVRSLDRTELQERLNAIGNSAAAVAYRF